MTDKKSNFVLVGVLCLVLSDTAFCLDNSFNKREYAEDEKTFGDMFNEFIKDLFGTSSSSEERQLNESSQDELKEFLTNISHSLASETENDSAALNLTTQTTEQPASDDVFTSLSTNFGYTTPLLSTVTKTKTPPSTTTKFTTSTTTTATTTTTTTTTSTTTTTPYWDSSPWYDEVAGVTEIPPEDDRCFSDILLQDFCPVPNDMIDVAFWDLYSVLFSDTVLDALMMGCEKGSWCLEDRFDYWESLIMERVDIVMNSEISTSMCQAEMQSCIGTVLDAFQDCPGLSHMEFTADALQLVCHLKENTELKSSCYKHVITALHVTVSDIMRKEDYEEETVAENKCASPEIEMTKGLICVANSCPGEAEAFQSFRPWSWFTSVADDLIEECQLDTTKCLALLQPPPGYIYGNDYATVIGVSAATMVATTLFTLTACLCYRRHRRNAVIKDGYQRLLNDGDQS